jgi:opacity protein-like surface antigen
MSGRWVVWAAAVMVGLSQAGYAANIEITPFYGYRFGGELKDADTGEEFDIDDSSCWGGMLDIRLSEITQLEFYFSRQETEIKSDDGLFDGQTLFDLDVDYYHIGGTYTFLPGRWQPFVAGTLGATHIDPDASGTDSLTRFSLGLGGGVRFFPTEHLGLYLAGRGLLTFIESDTLIRSESGRATVQVDSDGLWQVELQAGLVFAF